MPDHHLATNEAAADLDHDGCPTFECEIGAPVIDNTEADQMGPQDNDAYVDDTVADEDALYDQTDADETDDGAQKVTTMADTKVKETFWSSDSMTTIMNYCQMNQMTKGNN